MKSKLIKIVISFILMILFPTKGFITNHFNKNSVKYDFLKYNS